MKPQLNEVLALDLLCLTAADGGLLDADAHSAALTAALERSEWVVVRRGGALAAYAYMWPHEAPDLSPDAQSGAWFVGGLAIHPRHRAAPVVADLTRAFMAKVRDLGVATLHSHVLRSNGASVRLHRRLGFAIAQESEQAIAFVRSVDGLRFR